MCIYVRLGEKSCLLTECIGYLPSIHKPNLNVYTAKRMEEPYANSTDLGRGWGDWSRAG